MLKRKNIIKIAIDSPAAAGAGTQAKLISKYYNLLQLDTGRIYRYIANIKITEPKKFNYQYLNKKIGNLKISSLHNKKLLSDKVATIASIIAKDKIIRKLVHAFQLKCAYNPPKKIRWIMFRWKGYLFSYCARCRCKTLYNCQFKD